MTDKHIFSAHDCDHGIYLLEKSMSFMWAAALRSVTLLGVAEHLTSGPKSCDELADMLKLDAQALLRVMRILASGAVFKEFPEGYFSLTPAAHFLCKDHSHSLRSAILMLTDKTFWEPAGHLDRALKGEDVFSSLFGMPFYDYWTKEKHSRGEYDFHAGMSSMSTVENEIIADAYDFPHGATVADIAGGYGNLLLRVLRKDSSLRGILFDQSDILSKNVLHQLKDDTRWDTVSGSFFEKCPTADIYMLKYILMDWSDEKACQILSSCRRAMRADSKLLIIEPVIKDKDNEDGRYEIDMLLLASFDGGQARTEQALGKMLDGADLKISNIIHTHSYLSIVEAVIR
ncbi:O-methyltransferase [Enterobacter cloacae]|nr:O-methyltransferase [Enterobacter cloacae]